MGAGRFLKEQNPDVKIVAIEPPQGERVEGLRNLADGYIPPVFDDWNGFELLDRKRVVRPRESIEWTRRLVTEAGVFAGLSAGAAMAGAAKVAEEIDSGTIVDHRRRWRMEVLVDRGLYRRPRRGCCER